MQKVKRRGQTIVEFALVLTLLLLILLGILAYGLVFSWRHTLNNAAREGARAAAVGKKDSEVISIVRSVTSPLPNRDSVSIIIDPPEGSPYRKVGEPVTVTLIYPADIGFAFGGAIQRTYTLRAPATMRVEKLPPP